ncbi:polymorphic toxin type 22 domain-containing protein, partial [Caballeronia sp. LZ033]|uniref:polymorphic toxin type 22 domain-containing protein n=1 Tax=Caballeronia sp. LZ033 TaxID=3038566 RepID=UPI00285B31D8
SSKSASVGVSVGTNGFGISAAMANAHGDANSDAAIQNASQITGANSVAIVSGGDTNVIGSQIAGRQIAADVGANLNIASVQDTTVSAAHQSSAGGGFTISQGGGGASFSAQNGHADGNYAQVKEQAGLYAGDGGLDVSVKGNTALTGAVIAGADDAAKNSLSTGTLTFADVGNHSHYSANSVGGSVGLSPGPNSEKAVGTASVPGSGGPVPMIGQHESGDQSATTRSAVSPGTITLTDGDHQAQDIASLSRDMTNTNGTVATTPDVNEILNKQADTMQAAQAAGQVVAQGIGAYFDMKHALAIADHDQATADATAEGGRDRVIAHVIGGGLIGGLGGGGIDTAAGGAAGAGVAAGFAPQLTELAESVGNATGSKTLGNFSANIVAGAGGALAGGEAGAVTASNADLYNRQLHADEKTTAQQIADKARIQGITNPDGSPVTAAQIENAMRGANNSQYGEYASTGVVVPLNANTPANAVYDSAGMKLVTDSTGNYLVQDASMLVTPSKAVQDLITQNTGGASSPHSWGTSTNQVEASKVDPYGPFAPSWNTGDYAAGFGEYARGLAPDYATIGSGALSASAGLSVNLHDGTTYAAGGVTQNNPGSISVRPGGVASFGWIFGDRTAVGTNSFMNGDGVQGFISVPTLFNVNAFLAITHAYGGNTALEVGVASPGSTSFGASLFSHSVPISGSKGN